MLNKLIGNKLGLIGKKSRPLPRKALKHLKIARSLFLDGKMEAAFKNYNECLKIAGYADLIIDDSLKVIDFNEAAQTIKNMATKSKKKLKPSIELNFYSVPTGAQLFSEKKELAFKLDNHNKLRDLNKHPVFI